MHANPFIREVKLTKAQAKLLRNAEKALNEETDRQLDIINHSAAIALYRYHGWNNEQIHNLIAVTSQAVWNECAESKSESMIEMLWNEVGIELMCEDKSERWFEVEYLCSDIEPRPQTIYQRIGMRQNQVKWIAPQIMACMLMSLWRQEGWTDNGLARLYKEIESIKHDYDMDPDKLRQRCYEEVGFCITDEPEQYKEASNE